MSRVININNPTKIRNQNRRLIAELLRRLSQKPDVDPETKDMAAVMVFSLREIADGVEQSAAAWEKRGYWMKSERFIREWGWTGETAANLEDVIRNEAWDLLPRLLAEMFPRFADVQIKTMTKSPDTWHGAYKKLIAQTPANLPY
jgi:hypothetical protein